MGLFKIICVVLLMALSFNAKAATKEIVLTSDNTLILNNIFTSSSMGKLADQATVLDSKLKSGYPMYLVLRTPGGSIQAGLEMFEFMKGLNRPIHTVTLFAASMGFQAVQHLGDRYILKYGVLMSHKARGGFVGEFGDGMSQLDARYGLWLRRIALMDQKTVDRTKGKQTLKSYRAAYANELWLNGLEAVHQGYADAVVTARCDASLNSSYEEVWDLGFFSVVLEFSKCPLKTALLSVKINIITNKGEMDLKEFLKKGGKFGRDCRETATEETKYYGEVVPATEAELCAADKKLTLEEIYKARDKKIKWLNRDLKDNIVYSY